MDYTTMNLLPIQDQLTPLGVTRLVPAPWPETVWVGTLNLGVYRTTDFTGADYPLLQPTWSLDNTGLPDMTLASSTLFIMEHDPQSPRRQAVVVKDTVPSPDSYTVYSRVAGTTAWASVLTEAQAQSLASEAQAVQIWDITYNATLGTLYALVACNNKISSNAYLFYSGDNGSNWSVTPVALPGSLSVTRAGAVRARGLAVTFYATGSGGRWLFYATDGGTVFSRSTNSFPDSVHAFLFTYLYLIGTTSGEVYDVNQGALTWVELQAALSWDVQRDGIGWHTRNPDYQRLISDNKMFITHDAWATVEDTTPPLFTPQYIRHIWTPTRDFDKIVYGKNDQMAAFNPESVLVAGSEALTTLIGKSGASPDAAPFTDSIPYTSGGPCPGGLVTL